MTDGMGNQRQQAHALLDRLMDELQRTDPAPEGRGEALRHLGDLIRELDRGGAISAALLCPAVEPDEGAAAARARVDVASARRGPKVPSADVEQVEKVQITWMLAAHALHWMAGAINHPTVSSALFAVVGGLVDLSYGKATTGILDPLPLGPGRRPPSIVTESAAWPELVRLVHFKAGLDDRTVLDAWRALENQIKPNIDAERFEKRQRCVTPEEREDCRRLGGASRRGEDLSAEDRRRAIDFQARLDDPEALRRIGRLAAGAALD